MKPFDLFGAAAQLIFYDSEKCNITSNSEEMNQGCQVPIDPSPDDLFTLAFSGRPHNLCFSLYSSASAADTQYRSKVFKGNYVTDGRMHRVY